MRFGCAALLMLISFAVTASAQDQLVLTQNLDVRVNQFAALTQKVDVRVSPDQVVARIMSFDRNGDGKVAIGELSERMQGLVASGDRGGDGALDAAEIRSLTEKPQFVKTAFRNLQGGGYSFGDTVGLSSRTHIDNTIEDLRLAPEVNEQAKRIASAFSEELEGAALANLRDAVGPMLTEERLAEFERNIKNTGAGRTFRVTSSIGTQAQTFVVGADPRVVVLLGRFQLTPDQMKVASTAVERFKTEQQLDDARRSALVTQLSGILTDEERENFSAALARRPLVKAPGIGGGVVGGIAPRLEEVTNQLRNAVIVTRTPVTR